MTMPRRRQASGRPSGQTSEQTSAQGLAHSTGQSAARTPVRILIDTDPGLDDAIALWLALGAPDRLLVEAVTVTGGNVGLARCLANAVAVVGLTGREVPVHAGCADPLLGQRRDASRVHGADGLGAVRLPPGGSVAPGQAADAIRTVLRDAPTPVTLVGLGPVTNLALALATEPALASRVERIVLMSGAVGPGNITASAEFNAAGDPEALAMLLAAGPEVVFATLDLTAQALVTPDRIAALGGGGGCAVAARALLAAIPPSERTRARGGAPLHDPCAVAFLIAPTLFTGRRCRVEVVLAGPERGRTVVSSGRTNALLLETLEADGFFALLGEALDRLP